MQKLTLTKELKIYSREDILEAMQFIEKDVYFADSIEEIEEFKTDNLEKLTLEKIEIDVSNDFSIFYNDFSSYNFIAVEE